MSVTINDVLELPCMKNARVCGGKEGLSRIVTSISVLEFQEVNHEQEMLIRDYDYTGNELLITAFSYVREDVEAQCTNIRRMVEIGIVGVVIYYVGFLMTHIDQKLIDVADSLNLPLICMPENALMLRYSELITEVMSAIFKDQLSSPYFVSEILDQVSLLPDNQRSVNTVLRILSDRLRASIILTDLKMRVINETYWPRGQGEDYLSLLAKQPIHSDTPKVLELSMEEKALYVYFNPISGASISGMNMYIFRENDKLAAEDLRQAAVCIQLAVNLWSRQHEEVGLSELIRAILKDEPAKMQRLASIFNIDIASVHTMWLIRYNDITNKDSQYKKAKDIADNLLQGFCTTVISDKYDDYLVVFMNWDFSFQENSQLAEDLGRQLMELKLPATITLGHYLSNTAEVRSAFLLNHNYREHVKRIYPGRTCYTLREVLFAADCQRIIDQGEAVINEKLTVLKVIEKDDENRIFLQTLVTYLLDSENCITKTAELLFVHKNTIKYRINRIAQMLGYPVTKNPEQLYLNQAAAILRLLGKMR